MDYVAFEIGRGGPRQPRPLVADLIDQWDQTLDSAQSGLRFEISFRASGNYVLSSLGRQSVSSVSSALQQHLRRRFVVFSSEEFLAWLETLEHELSEPPTVSIAREPNRGAVMDLNPAGGVPGALPAPTPPRDAEAWTSSDFAIQRVRGVWKNDVRKADGRRDETKRDGTWGALSQAMRRAYGGDWTARAVGTLTGLARKVRARLQAIALPGEAQAVPNALTASESSPDAEARLRSIVQPPPITRAIGTLLEAYHARGSTIHIVVQARRIAEMLARRICAVHGLSIAGRQFVDVCRDIANHDLLTHKQQTYLHTLRKIGNFAAPEAQEGDVKASDVEVVLWMLVALAADTRRNTAAVSGAGDTTRLQQTLADPALSRLYRELVDEDLTLVEEGMAEYRRQLNAADGA